MIIIKNGRDMQIPQSDKYLVQGDNKFTKRYFKIDRIVDGVDISEYVFTLQVEPVNKSEVPYYDLIEKTVNESDILLTWTIMRHDVKDSGELKVNLKIADLNDEIFSTYTGEFKVKASIDTDRQADIIPPSYIEQGIVEVTSLVGDAVQQAALATEEANRAKDEADRSKSEADRSNESALVCIEKEYLTSQDYEGTTSDRQIVADSKRDVLDAKEVVLQAKEEILGEKGQPNGVATLDSLGKVNEIAKDSEKFGGQLPTYYTPASNFNSLIETVNSKIENLTVDNENGTIKTYKNGIESSTSIIGLISGAFHDPTTGKLTLTVKGSQNIVVDIGKDKFCESGYFDASTNEIVFVMNDGSEIRFDVQHLIDVYVGGDTSSVRVTVNGYTIFADVLISSDENNRLEEREDGLYVSPTDLSAYRTKNENDLLYLGINSQAEDSKKLNGKSESELSVNSAIKADKLSSAKRLTFNGVASGEVNMDFSASEYSVTLAHNVIPWTVVTPVGDAVTIDAQQDDMIVMTNSNPVQLTINNLSSGAILIVRIYGNTLDEEYLNDTYGIVIPDYCKYIVATNVDQAYEYIIESDGVKTTATRSVVV